MTAMTETLGEPDGTPCRHAAAKTSWLSCPNSSGTSSVLVDQYCRARHCNDRRVTEMKFRAGQTGTQVGARCRSAIPRGQVLIAGPALQSRTSWSPT